MKIRKNVAVLSLAAAALFAAGCDYFHYHPVTETRSVTGFSGVALDGVGKLRVYPSDDYSMEVTADMDVIDHVTATLDTNGVLRIGLDMNARYDDGNVYVRGRHGGYRGEMSLLVGMPQTSMRSVALKGVGNIIVYDGNTDTFAVNLSGVGNICARNLHIRNASAILTGVGDITLKASDYLGIFHEGVGDINAHYDMANVVTIVHRGTGTIKVYASDTMYVSISARAGEIRYAGNPVIRMFRFEPPNGVINNDGVIEPDRRPAVSSDDVDRRVRPL